MSQFKVAPHYGDIERANPILSCPQDSLYIFGEGLNLPKYFKYVCDYVNYNFLVVAHILPGDAQTMHCLQKFCPQTPENFKNLSKHAV